ncbi:hypothetical protein ACJX0J_014383, partial [Zea mays]
MVRAGGSGHRRGTRSPLCSSKKMRDRGRRRRRARGRNRLVRARGWIRSLSPRPYRELRSCLDLTGPRDYSSPEEMVQRLTSASTVLRRVLDNPALQDYQENNGFGDLNCPAACTASPSPTGSTGPQARCREADTDRRETVPPQFCNGTSLLKYPEGNELPSDLIDTLLKWIPSNDEELRLRLSSRSTATPHASVAVCMEAITESRMLYLFRSQNVLRPFSVIAAILEDERAPGRVQEEADTAGTCPSQWRCSGDGDQHWHGEAVKPTAAEPHPEEVASRLVRVADSDRRVLCDTGCSSTMSFLLLFPRDICLAFLLTIFFVYITL